jgi:hypothetical protein
MTLLPKVDQVKDSLVDQVHFLQPRQSSHIHGDADDGAEAAGGSEHVTGFGWLFC